MESRRSNAGADAQRRAMVGDAADPLAGNSAPMRALRDEIAAVADIVATALIVGETGVGKGVVARVLHRRSSRRAAPFVHVDCASLSSQIVESELFGHERGAFTGASSRRAGRFEQAAHGTLFLDEIGDLEARLQAKLLRVLEDRSFERLGGNRTLRMSARIVAATTRDLRRDVADGRFRADLFHRLDVIRIEVPPLRERADDIAALIEALAQRAGLAQGPRLSDCALRRLAAHAWPGNVRELSNVVERIAVRCRGPEVTAAQLDGLLDDELPGAAMFRASSITEARASVGSPDPAEHIVSTLRETGGNVARAARRLGLPRTTLRHRIRRYGIE